MSRNSGWGSLLLLGLVCSGCSKEQRDQMAEKLSQAKEQVSAKAEGISKKAGEKISQSAESLVPDGRATMILDNTVEFSASFANLVTMKNRGSVLQLRSYSPRIKESFPSYFFQASCSSPSLNGLLGQTVTGVLFVKTSNQNATLVSDDLQQVTLAIDSIQDSKLKGRFVSGSMLDAHGKSKNITGTFEAMIEGGLE